LSVDVYAPGDRIASASVAGYGLSDIKSGTSMATAYVAGMIAYIEASAYYDRTPAEMLAAILDLTLKNKLTGIPANINNKLLWNGMHSDRVLVLDSEGQVVLTGQETA